ncbi:MAG: hypothetical protein AAFZ07_30000, partial [Actinomycetota bacterium]
RGFGENWISGVILLIALGMPFVFGALVALTAGLRSNLAGAMLPLPVAIVLLEAGLIALLLVSENPTAAGLMLLGLVVVHFLWWVGTSIRAKRRGAAVSVRWWIGYGAGSISAVLGWLFSQALREGVFSLALVAATGCAAIVAALARIRVERAA